MPDPDAPEKIELNEREIAIAQGTDPDEPSEEPDPQPEAQVDETTDPLSEEPQEETGDTSDKPSDPEPESEPVAEEQPEEWVTGPIRDLAVSYGMNEDELKDFGSEEAFRKTAVLFDRHLSAPQKQEEPQQQAPPADQPQKEETPAPEKFDMAKLRELDYDADSLKLFERADADRETIERLEGAVKEMGQFIEAQRESQRQESSRRLWDEFHGAVDNHNEGRYGKSVVDGHPTALLVAHEDARRKLFDSMETIVVGLTARAKDAGKEPDIPPIATLIDRADMLAFTEENRTAEMKKIQEAASRQSSKRRPVSGSRPAAKPAPKRELEAGGDPAQELYDNPEISAMYAKLQEEEGMKP
jgi:hypothetical protein